MKKIILIVISLSILLNANLTRNNNGVVSDSNTGLEWQDTYSNSEIKQTTWENAIDYCEELSLDSKYDWRLPNKNELISIVLYGKSSPSIDSIFVHTESTAFSYYFSSTSYASNHNLVWAVSFVSGTTDFNFRYNISSVRCVRDYNPQPAL